jgi:hypothetical protein
MPSMPIEKDARSAGDFDELVPGLEVEQIRSWAVEGVVGHGHGQGSQPSSQTVRNG